MEATDNAQNGEESIPKGLPKGIHRRADLFHGTAPDMLDRKISINFMPPYAKSD